MPKKTSGTCSNDVECSSGYCTDGMCCNARCNGQCESCSTGTCNASTTPRTPCGGNGKCAGAYVSTNRASCTFPDSTTTCVDPGCVYYVPGNGATSSAFPGTIYAYAETSSGGVDSMPVMTASLTRYSWTPISATFGNSDATDLYLGIVVSVSNDSGGAGQALWFDNVYVQ